MFVGTQYIASDIKCDRKSGRNVFKGNHAWVHSEKSERLSIN